LVPIARAAEQAGAQPPLRARGQCPSTVEADGLVALDTSGTVTELPKPVR
jgi:hypothetical protein